MSLRILIANDDGITSPGIEALAQAVSDLGEVTVVAPNRERSTSGHSLTLHKPLRVAQVAPSRYSTSGTPADCIYLGMREVLKAKPDVILSGINSGANLGTDVHYSGTVAAAREAALMNIRSYAFSLVDIPKQEENLEKRPLNFKMAAQMSREVILKTIGVKFPPHTLLNVNIPNGELKDIQGMRVARQGFRYYANEVLKRQDPRGRDYYWIGGGYLGFEKLGYTDCDAVDQGFVSIVPITIDNTHNEFYATLGTLFPKQ